ncbi:MAG: CDP-diacylglycerol--glycerol-3-phosphate 3-phosphatidyltransferase [Verrucomicrobiota bacterium]
MTTANKITILRILLVPFFIVQLLVYVESGDEWYRLLAILSFALAAFGDALDGYVARRYNQHSELGAILDPLADKLLLLSGVVVLSLPHQPYLDRLPLWLVATVISRDMLLLIGMVVIHYACGKVIVRAHIIGKMATVLQMGAVLWILLKWNEDWLRVWTVGAAVCTGISGVLYLLDGVRQLSASPSSAASPKQSGADAPVPVRKTE